MLRDFWGPFQARLQEVDQVTVRQVIDELDALLGPHLFRPQASCLHALDSVSVRKGASKPESLLLSGLEVCDC